MCSELVPRSTPREVTLSIGNRQSSCFLLVREGSGAAGRPSGRGPSRLDEWHSSVAQTVADGQSSPHKCGESVQEAAHLGRYFVVTHGVDYVRGRHSDGVVLLQVLVDR